MMTNRTLAVKILIALGIFALGLSFAKCSRPAEEKKATNPFPNKTEGDHNEQVELPPLSENEILDRSLRIDVFNRGRRVSKGSGVCLGQDVGLTNWHVVQRAALEDGFSGRVVTRSGASANIEAVAIDFAYFDVALIKFRPGVCPGSVSLKDPLRPPTSSSIFNVSSPEDSSFATFRSSLDSLQAEALGNTSFRSFNFNWVPYETQILTSKGLASAGVGPGSSGSAVFQDGRMLGVVFAKGGRDNRIFIVDSSFLTLKPSENLEWHRLGASTLRTRMTETVSLNPSEDTLIPLPLSYSIQSKLPSSSATQHTLGRYWDFVRSAAQLSQARLTYGNGSGTILCVIRSQVAGQAGLVTIGTRQDLGLQSCSQLEPTRIIQEQIFFDDNDDGFADRISASTRGFSF